MKILRLFTSIDISCNKLEGPIPEELAALKSLYVVNLSHNALTGHIPPSLGNLSQLESLDLSSNNLTAEIPVHLVDSLTFLSFLNLSFNQLVGKIPQASNLLRFQMIPIKGTRDYVGTLCKQNAQVIKLHHLQQHKKLDAKFQQL